MKKVSTIGLVLVLLVAAGFAAGTAFARKPPPPPPPPKSCVCPDVYQPVICSDGVVYSNLCVASCNHATGCVPYGDTTVVEVPGMDVCQPPDPDPDEAGFLFTCRCPLIYAPVICDHDKVYPNPCEADCHHAKNCVPYGF